MRLGPLVLTIAVCCSVVVPAACSKGGDQQGTAGAGSGAGASGGATATGGDSLRSATASGPGGAPATSNGTNAGGNTGAQSMSDAQIASTVGAINGGEIMAAQLARRKAASNEVKAFARMMITDHTAMQHTVDSLAKAKNITPQSPPTADSLQSSMKAQGDTLGRLTGRAFDRAYITSQVAGHQQALDMLNRFAGSAQDADMKAALQKAVPKVQQHLDRARTIQSSLPTGG
jgi:putative membrane protein